jgi:hypothetical protein
MRTLMSCKGWANTGWVKKIQRRFAPLALMLFVFGCAGCVTADKRLYDGPPRERGGIALLKVQWSALGDSARIETIDGKPVEKGRLFALNIKEAELLPGEHTLEVSYFDGNIRSLSSMPLTFTCKAGALYELHVAPVDEGFKGSLYVAAGGKGYWTAWIVDSDTHEVLAGNPRTTPLRWYE